MEMCSLLSASAGARPPRTAISSPDRLHVPFCRNLEGLPGLSYDVLVPPCSVDAVERVWRECGTDAFDGPGVERDQIGIAVHEAHVAAILNDLQDVPREQRSPA